MLVRTGASLKRVNDVLITEPSIKNDLEVKQLKKLEYDALLEFKNVCFNYAFDPKEKSFIKDLSFKLYPGETLGIIGGTGSGKTTIASLMTRFYDVTLGEILYKGKNIKEFSLEQLRHEISIVQQRSVLFSGSLRDNVTFIKSDASDEEINYALKVSESEEFVNRLPNGLDTIVGEDGVGLSEGQIQRIAIARAVLTGAPIMLLDESTSALDEETERRVLNNLRAMEGKTLIIISHKKAAANVCNRIIRIKDKRFVEESEK
jgi:ATP-binding cassette subfamily B protein